MQMIMNILAGVTGLYMLLIFIRIMLTWFSGSNYGRPMEILCQITDPYLDWFRRFPGLRAGFLDLSPIVAMAVLSLANNIFMTLAHSGVIRIGSILAMALSAIWSAASFILGFFILVLILRLIAYLTNRNTYGSFWRIIDTVSQPILYRLNRLLFHRRLVNYRTGILASIGLLGATMIIAGFLVNVVITFFYNFPF